MDKLLKLAAKEQVENGPKMLLVVDEAGILSTHQAHHILQLSERHGAKVVFAGDTRQQQPAEAGPGLRLIRDVAVIIRVDRIRRQKADLEDVLVHVHKETLEQARFRGGADQSAGARSDPCPIRSTGEEAPVEWAPGSHVATRNRVHEAAIYCERSSA